MGSLLEKKKKKNVYSLNIKNKKESIDLVKSKKLLQRVSKFLNKNKKFIFQKNFSVISKSEIGRAHV